MHSRAALAAVVLLGVLALASPAHAALLPLDCEGERTRAFQRWGDPLLYRLAEGGAVGDGAGWSVSGGRVAGGKLSLPRRSSATSPRSCLSLLSPTARFMVRSTGSPLGVLAVSAVVRDGDGLLEKLPIGVVTGLTGSAWRPSLPMLLTPSLVPQLADEDSSVRFRFKVTGLGGAFEVDDLYIDPYGRG